VVVEFYEEEVHGKELVNVAGVVTWLWYGNYEMCQMIDKSLFKALFAMRFQEYVMALTNLFYDSIISTSLAGLSL